MIGVEPRLFRRAQQLHIHKCQIDGCQGQRLEIEHVAFGACDEGLFHDDQILDADAIGAGLVIARLVGQDHARFERHRTDFRDALRPLVYGEIGADAMARAMVEIEPGFPQRQPRQHVELRAGRAFRKHCTRNADMALQHAREAVAHFGAGLADAQRARDVGGAVLILRAGIDEVEPFADDAIARLGHPVMHDGAIGPRTRDGGKGHILQLARLAAKCFKRLRRSDLRQLAALGRPRKPGEKAHHGHAVAQMRSARPLDLGGILAGLHQRDRIGADLGHAARAFQRLRELCGDGGGVEAHRRALLAQPCQIGQKLRGRGNVGQSFQCRAHIARQLARIDIEHGPAALGDQRKGQRQRRMGDIGPTNVESPRHCMRIADDQRCDLRERLFDALQFSRSVLAGIAFGVQAHRRQRRRRSVTPDVIERIVLDRHEAGAGGLGSLGETTHLSRRQ